MKFHKFFLSRLEATLIQFVKGRSSISPKRILALLSILILLYPSGRLAAQTQNAEKNLDDKILGDENSQNSNPSKPGNQNSWRISGFLENENFFQLREEPGDGKGSIVKEEGRLNLNLKYGSDFFYGKLVSDLYFYPQNDYYTQARESGTIELQEAYVQMGEKLQLRIGKQLFQWGNADMFHVSNFFDQPDLREMFASDKEDLYKGVYAIKGKIIWRSFSLEAALMPVYSGPLYPGENSFWTFTPSSVQFSIPAEYQAAFGGMTSLNLPPVFSDQNDQTATWNNSSYGIRAGGTLGWLDFYLSYFHGISNAVSFYSEINLDTMQLNTSPISEKEDSVGLNLAFNIDRFAIRIESNYTPNKLAAVENSYSLKDVNGTQFLSQDLMRAHYFNYTFGIDANLWGDDGRILAEWTHGVYLENEETRNNLEENFLNQLLLLRLEDSFVQKHLKIEIGAILRPDSKQIGWAPFADVTWDFFNGIELAAGTLIFYGNGEELFSLFDNYDYTYLKAKVVF